MTKNEYFKKLEQEKNNYQPLYEKLITLYKESLRNYNMEHMNNCMSFHRNIVINEINNLIGFFDLLNVDKSMVILTGSFSRNTNLLFSDIDLSYIYNNNLKDKLLNEEDKMQYMLSCILGFRGRDRIHGITYYLPKISNDIGLEEINNNEYKLVFDDGIYYYKCRENAEKTMFNTFNSTRSIDDLKKYIIDNLNIQKSLKLIRR